MNPIGRRMSSDETKIPRASLNPAIETLPVEAQVFGPNGFTNSGESHSHEKEGGNGRKNAREDKPKIKRKKGNELVVLKSHIYQQKTFGNRRKRTRLTACFAYY